ncbi:SICAvar, type I [Plasmodium knowlesi strain H]|uniref:SICAvar, type I n=1 Tax=Plasmodium knowlesi (strain H) TaxID=5851 RepID=A0A193QUW6_PLAKH|nr:SICAvar, type I [Plasmodium knowlesi strain H]
MSTVGGDDPFRAWLDKHTNGAQATGTDATEKARKIEKKMKTDLEGEWKKLRESLERPGSMEISGLCADAKDLVDAASSTPESEYMQNLCSAIAEIKYFMSGIKSKRELTEKGTVMSNDEKVEKEDLTDEQAYSRCIVGTVALRELYGDHCQMNGIIGQISSNVDATLRGHLNNNAQGLEHQLNKCEGITPTHLMFGKSLLASTIRGWAQGDREKELRKVGGSQGARRVGYVWRWWPRVCKKPKPGDSEHDEARKEILQQNKKSLVNFTLGKNTQSGSNASSTMEDILVNDDYTISQEKLTKALQDSMQSDTAGSTTLALDKAVEKLTKAAKETEGKYPIINVLIY